MAHRIAVIAGDGVGPEVIDQALLVAGAAGADLDTTPYDLGADRYVTTGEVLPDTVLDELDGHDAILLGAVGDPRVPPGVLERGLLLRLRFTFDQYVNLRPVKLFPGVRTPIEGLTPERCDMVIVRENTEGLYVGAGGAMRVGTPHEVATQESLNTRMGVERIVRYAAARAAERSGSLTVIHKTNVLAYAGDLWMRTAEDIAEETGVELSYMHVDAACLHMVERPEILDVAVTDNLFGDIVTDLGAAVQGGMGFAASGNIAPEHRHPSMFEPVHGSAPDIAGTGKANPAAAVMSVAMMLRHLGDPAADRIEAGFAAAAPSIDWTAVETAAVGEAIARAVAG
jgi:3-isopropylmalate dehydrogenase